MPYYHVLIRLKTRKGAIEHNLVEKDLVKNIVKPYNKGELFKCGDSVANRDDISHIKITKVSKQLFFTVIMCHMKGTLQNFGN